jgi:hypothetical protein
MKEGAFGRRHQLKGADLRRVKICEKFGGATKKKLKKTLMWRRRNIASSKKNQPEAIQIHDPMIHPKHSPV